MEDREEKMTRQNLRIDDFEDKKGKSGQRYTRFKTSAGWMSCFDKVVSENLKKLEGKVATVEVTESGDFKNITAFYGEGETVEQAEAGEVQVQKIEEKKKPRNLATMYTSYAKDIFCTELNCMTPEMYNKTTKKQLMEECIKLVKLAKSAFELEE